jgi:predicted methyltransferase
MRTPVFLGFAVAVAVTVTVTTGGCKKTPDATTAGVADAAPAATSVAPADAAAAAPSGGADRAQAIVDAADRTAADREEDASRKPAELLRFLGVGPGMKVADLGAGGGYLTELLARAVGPEGVVYGQNNKVTIEKFVSKSWPERLARPVNAKVVRVDRELDDPLPPEAKDLDLVTIGFLYHDAVWMKTDMDKMNRAVFAALKPGGAYVILDHAADEGAGTTVAEKLHRIEKQVVIDQVTGAGFKLDGEGTFLANPQDPRDTNVFDEKIRGKTDRFVLRFVKP